VLEEGLCGDELPCEIDGKGSLEVGDRSDGDRCRGGQVASVGDVDVDGAYFGRHLGEGGVDGGFVSDVGLVGEEFGLVGREGLDGGFGFVERLELAAEKHDVAGASEGECFGKGDADALAAASD